MRLKPPMTEDVGEGHDWVFAMRRASSRRAALSLLAGVGFAAKARAQDAPAVPQPAPTPARQPAATGQSIDKTKTYYVFFDQVIDVNSMRNLRKQLTNLVEAGVSEIMLVINSGGGQVEPTLVTYSFILALPAKINTHALGFVQSAATLLFLSGEQRSADHNARFTFHPTVGPMMGPTNEQQLREGLAGFLAVTDVMAQIYRERTHLTDAEIERFKRETVIYTAEQAKDAGVLQTVADLRIPGENKAKIMFLE